MKLLDLIFNIIRGACMAAADSVPGVSGGTIAFILGFYEKFVSSINDLLLGPFDAKKKALPFLITLGIGWAGCFLVCASVLSLAFKTHIYDLSSLFLGLTLAAIPLVVYEERECLKGKYYWLIFTVIGAGLVLLLMNLGSFGSVDITQMNPLLALILFVSGALAISVMLLPGISGSTVLLILGLYVPLISAVSACVHLNFSALPALLVFALGIIFGLAVFTKVVRWCFKKFRPQTMYLILGLLIGSFYAIIRGPATLAEPLSALSFDTFSALFFVLGILIIAVLQIVKVVTAKKRAGK
ncbi:MAG TPA: DUF368 domain-containing protein [Methanocorpusculum sp.]|nr:DUF368 domain-containing protein [Methanocorpusculum sp.]